MLPAILIQVPFFIVPLLQVPSSPTRDCLRDMPPLPASEAVVEDFEARIQAYVSLHRRLSRWVPPMTLGDEEGDFYADDLRAALIEARPQAHQGNFFTRDAADVFRARIDTALLRGVAPPVTKLYEPLLGEGVPEVNQPFPLVRGVVEWPALAAELPPLPPELGYAWWGRDLVLVDVAVNLVLDVLPQALPEGAYPGVVYP